MAYISQFTSEEIDNSLVVNNNQDIRLNSIETKLNTVEINANHFELTNNCINTNHLINAAITAEKLAPEVADSLASIKTYKGTLLANNWMDKLSNNINYSSYVNQWKWERFSSHTCDASIRTTLYNETPIETLYRNDVDISYTAEWNDNYTARCTTYLYCPEAISYECKAATDDGGAVYINGDLVTILVSCQETNIIIPFKKGVNCLEMFYTEGSGGDGWEFWPDFSTRVGHEFSHMYAVPAHEFYQTITPICLDGDSKINEFTIFSPGMLLNGNLTLASYRDILNMGYIQGNNDGSITINYTYPSIPSQDIELYWFGKTVN